MFLARWGSAMPKNPRKNETVIHTFVPLAAIQTSLYLSLATAFS